MTLGKTPRGRLSQQYIDVVNSFVTFAMTIMDQRGNISWNLEVLKTLFGCKWFRYSFWGIDMGDE